MYKFDINNLNSAHRVALIDILKHFLIEYKIEGNIMIIYRIRDEIFDFLESQEIFPEKL